MFVRDLLLLLDLAGGDPGDRHHRQVHPSEEDGGPQDVVELLPKRVVLLAKLRHRPGTERLG